MKQTWHLLSRRCIVFVIASMRLEHGMSETLSTGFTGPYHADGNLFTLEAKSKQVSIQGFAINVDAGPTTIEIYSRSGVIVTKNLDGGWNLMHTAQVTGQGKGNITSLPDFAAPIVIPAYAKRSFYVTATNNNDVWYNIGQQVEQVYATDENLNVLEGYALGYGFVGATGPRRWNGKRMNCICCTSSFRN
jgi:hypothetical protein